MTAIALPARVSAASPVARVGLPLLGLAVGIVLILSRRPDVIVHPGFWAEDGAIYFGDVYNLGVVHTILHPQAGYFETVPVLVAWIARIFGVRDAPFVMALIALVIQALPVGLLLSRRAETIGPLWARAAIAAVYLALPSQLELDATAVNAQWSLAVAGLVILLYSPPLRRGWRALDTAILLAVGLTGPFAIVLAPLGWIRRWRRGDAFVPWPTAAVLTGCALLQIAATLVISHHESGPGIEARPHPQLGASATLFARLVGGRTLLGAFMGENRGITAPAAAQWAAIIAAVILLIALIRYARQEIWMFLALGGFVLLGTLVDPSVPTPAWLILSLTPVNSPRYFYLPELVILVTLIWIAAQTIPTVLRCGAGALVAVALGFAIADHWTYPSLPSVAYAAHVTAFERLPAGHVEVFPQNPPGWSMSLVRR